MSLPALTIQLVPSPPATPTPLTPLQTVALVVPVVTAVILLVFGVNNVPDLWRKVAKRREQRRLAKNSAADLIDTLPHVASLINRIEEVQRIAAAISADVPLVSVAGRTGVGKSAVAVSAVAAYRDNALNNSRTTRKNTLWLDAHNCCPALEDLARMLSLAFDQPGISAAPSRDKELVVRNFLAANPTVLIIDNFAPPASPRQQVLMDLLESLPAKSCGILSWGESITTEGELVQIEDLDLEHAGTLLLREADRHGVILAEPANVEDTIRETYARLGGNPQGLRWLVLEIKKSARTVADTLEKLTARDSQIYAELFGNIWETLDSEQKNILIGAAEAQVPASGEYLMAATGLKEKEVHETIENLLALGILERATEQHVVRVRLPNITRSYVVSNADRRRISNTRRRLARYYIRRLESDWEDAAGIEHDIENVIQVFLKAKQDGDCSSALRLFELILDILFTLGLFDDRINLGHAAVECARQLGRPADEALAWSVISSTHTVRGEYRLSDAALISGRAAAEQSGSTQAIAYQARCRAYNLYREGHTTKAENELEGVLELADSAGDINGAIDVLALKCSLALHDKRQQEARHHVDDFNQRIHAAGWRRAEAYPYQEYAELELWERNLAEAARWASKARDIAVQYRDRRQEIRVKLTLGRIAMYGGQLGEAKSLLRKAAEDASQYGLVNELAEIRAHLVLASRRPRWIWRAWYTSCKVPNRLCSLPIGGD